MMSLFRQKIARNKRMWIENEPSKIDLMDLFNFNFNSASFSYHEHYEGEGLCPKELMTYATYLFLTKFGGTERLMKSLNTSYEPNRVSGITEDSVEERREKHGTNYFPCTQSPSLGLLLS